MRASALLGALVGLALVMPAHRALGDNIGAISFTVVDQHKHGVPDIMFTVTVNGADQTATTGGDQPTDSELAAAARKGDAAVDALRDRYASRALLVDLPLANATVTPDLVGAKPFTIALTTAQPAWSVSITVDSKTKRIIGAPRIVVDTALAEEHMKAARSSQSQAATATVPSPTAPSPSAPATTAPGSASAVLTGPSQAATAPAPIKADGASAVGTPATSPPAGAVRPPALDPHRQRYVGIGYKLGDGIGFAGADLILSPVSHLTLDLFASYLSVTASDGSSGGTIALAPAIQVHLRDGWRSSPYVALGLQYVSITAGSVTATGTGAFGNIGWDFRFSSGLGILLGVGVQEFQATGTSGTNMVTVGSNGPAFNLELGLRYMFL